MFFAASYMATYYMDVIHLTQDQVFILQIILQVTLFFTGIPAGLLADRFGLKRIAVIGSAVQCTAYVVTATSTTFTQLVAALVLSGLYGALLLNVLGSVMMSSLGYISDSEKRYQEFRAYQAKVVVYRGAGIVTGVSIGGVLLYVGLERSILMLQPITSIVGMVLALRLIEPKFRADHGISVIGRVARQVLIEKPALRSAILLHVSVVSCGFACFWMYQSRLKVSELPLRYFGVVYFFYQIAGMLIGKCIPWLRGKKGKRDLVIWRSGTVGLASLAIIAGMTTSATPVLVLMLVQICTGVTLQVLVRTLMFETLPNSYSTRTAELAVSTTVVAMGNVVASLVAYYLTGYSTLAMAFVVAGIASLGLSQLAFRTFQKNFRK